MSTVDLALGTVYVAVLFGSFTYLLRSKMRRYRRARTIENLRELRFMFPFWIVALSWTVSLVVAFFFDLTTLGELVRQVVGWVTIASLATGAGIAAFDERIRNRTETA